MKHNQIKTNEHFVVFIVITVEQLYKKLALSIFQ